METISGPSSGKATNQMCALGPGTCPVDPVTRTNCRKFRHRQARCLTILQVAGDWHEAREGEQGEEKERPDCRQG